MAWHLRKDGISISSGQLLVVQYLIIAGKCGVVSKAEFSTMAGPAGQHNDSHHYPLSHGQEALWFLYNLSPDHCAYNINFAWDIEYELDIPFLKRALQAIVDRHPSLRTTFVEGRRGELRQRVHPQAALDFLRVDSAGWNRDRLREVLVQESYRPFDLAAGPVSRWRLYSSGRAEHLLLLSIHHIVTDYTSIVLMLEELSAMFSEGRIMTTCSGDGSGEFAYGDFVKAQRQKLSEKHEEKLSRFWRRQLREKVEPLDLPTDFPRPPELDYRGDQLSLPVPSELAGTLRHIARREGVGLNILYLSAFSLLLHRYSRQRHILVSLPVTCRTLNSRDVCGYFINPVVLALDFADDRDARSLFEQVRQRLFQAILHKDYPFSKLVSALETTSRRLDMAPVSQAFFNWLDLESFSRNKGLIEVTAQGEIEWRIGGMVWRQYDLRGQNDDFDVVLELCHGRENDLVHLQYNRSLFSRKTVEGMAAHYLTLLRAMAAAADTPVSRLPLLGIEERSRILEEWSNCGGTSLPFQAMHRRFEERVRQQPDALALIDGARELTCSGLNRLANQMAHFVSARGAGPGKLVGVCLERSATAVICLMAIAKAGAAYVPLDPNYPRERLAFMAADAGIALVLTESSARQAVPAGIAEVVLVDEWWPEILQENGDNLDRHVSAGDLAYVIYTSGSSGRPKGVAVEHGGVSALIASYGRVFSGHELAGVGAVTSLNFDISVMDIFATLGLGGTLILVADPLTLGELFARERIRLLIAAPSTVASLVRIGALPQSLETVGLGGDVVRQGLVDALYGLGHVKRVYNMYGPTEETVWATYAMVPQGNAADPHIGRPIAKTEVYILDDHLQPVPAGVPGELCLGGPGVARGYLNRPELTAKRFIAHPFCGGGQREGRARLYRTGDLARFRHDGNIEFLGRIDAQVKIRGFRIELGEVEAVLQQHPDVVEAAAVVRADRYGEKYLQACIVAKASGLPDEELLKAYLRERLPGYMIPSAITRVEALPIGPSGKLDRRALPEPDFLPKKPEPEQKTEGTGGTVGLIARIWREELGRDDIAIDENFFDAGGHSLLMVVVFTRLKELFGDWLFLTDLYQYPTIRSLAGFLDRRSKLEGRVVAVGCAAGKETLAGKNRVAIVGMACRFPGAADKDEFWANIQGGIESISDCSRVGRKKNFVGRSGQLDGIELFDAEFFGITPREAEIMDPQHRLFLECAWHALEDAGIDPERSEGLIGVYGGCGCNSYLSEELVQTQQPGRFNMLLANSGDFLSSRIAYKLNLKGPAVNVQTACSTSMTALHLAVGGLMLGDCDIALAGGISLGDLQEGYLFREGMIMSAEGRCRPFDLLADGTVPSQGVGMVVLKRLDEAIAANHHIYAIVLGSAVNNDGSGKAGFSAPAPSGQAEVIAAAQARAGVEPAAISYVEAHGTGTRVGDPVEVIALSTVFGPGDGEGSCALGAVKANIGHPDAAAGIAGVIKTALALKYRLLPPQINYANPNEEIHFAGTPFFVNTALRPWTTDRLPRRAGVSSFGLGGCNGHVVLEEPPELPATCKESAGWQLLPFSAARLDGLAEVAGRLAEFLRHNPRANLQDIAFTLQLGRKRLPYREFIVAYSVTSAAEQLAEYASGGTKLRRSAEDAGESGGGQAASLAILGRQWREGVEVDWAALHEGQPRLLSLPGYPFRRQRYWLEKLDGVRRDDARSETIATEARPILSSGEAEDDGTERAIAAIWDEYLGLGEYQSDDDFFDSGGDSLVAVMMLSRLRERFGVELSGDILIGRSTLGRLAEYVREQLRCRSRQENPVEPQHCILLKPGSPSCPPLFLCHPGAGHLYFYLDLVKHLDIPGPVYGIEAMGLRPAEQPLPTIEAIARHHLEQIRRIRSHGPYWLGGSSFGGMVAYEVAQQLLAMGETVEFLYMVDTPGPGHMIGPIESNAHILSHLFADFFGDQNSLKEQLMRLEHDPQQQIEFVVQEAHALGKAGLIPANFSRHFLDMVRTHVEAMRSYSPQPYPGFLLYFRQGEPMAEYSSHAEMAWLPLAQTGADVHTVPGNHITMNFAPNVFKIIAHLQRNIEELSQGKHDSP